MSKVIRVYENHNQKKLGFECGDTKKPGVSGRNSEEKRKLTHV